MDQDGKLDLLSKPAQAQLHPTNGKLTLTLCKPSEIAADYRYAVIPLPTSYYVACAEALKAFTAHIPLDTEAVSLCLPVERKDGQYVWSVLREDAWDTVLQSGGGELGVFLPNVTPNEMPYSYLKAAKIVRFETKGGRDFYIRVMHSYKECQDFAKARGHQLLRYDARMVGTQAERKAYRDQDTDLNSGTQEIWCPLNASLFEYLSSLHPEPMRILLVKD